MTDKTKNILVVDDEPAVRKLVTEAFAAPEFRIYTAKDGVEALRLIDDSSAAIDILLVDVVMPRLNGPELVRVILSYHPEIKIIFMSGYPNDILDQYGIVASRIRYIKKPFIPDILVQAVREELSK
jgi:two-component system, cell cycle sensor histidine kinase and response regulator CckA